MSSQKGSWYCYCTFVKLMKETNLVGVIKTVWKWKKTILTVTIVCAILSIVAALLMPNYYQSNSLFYAASQDLAKPMPLGDSDRDVDYYGNDLDIDRLLSIAYSSPLKVKLIEQFDLYNKYNIDPSSNNAAHKVREKLDKMMTVQKTKFGAISLGIEDKDRNLSYELTKAATNYIDQSASGQWKKSQQNLLESYKVKILESEADISIINDSLSQLKKDYGIFDLTNQSEILLSQQSSLDAKKISIAAKLSSNLVQDNSDSLDFYSALKNGIDQQVSSINNKIQRFNAGFNEIASLERQQIQMTRQIAIDKERHSQLQASFNSPVSGIIQVEEPEVPIYKSRPKRSIYVIAATFLSFLFMSLYAIVYETYLKNDQHTAA